MTINSIYRTIIIILLLVLLVYLLVILLLFFIIAIIVAFSLLLFIVSISCRLLFLLFVCFLIPLFQFSLLFLFLFLPQVGLTGLQLRYIILVLLLDHVKCCLHHRTLVQSDLELVDATILFDHLPQIPVLSRAVFQSEPHGLPAEEVLGEADARVDLVKALGHDVPALVEEDVGKFGTNLRLTKLLHIRVVVLPPLVGPLILDETDIMTPID